MVGNRAPEAGRSSLSASQPEPGRHPDAHRIVATRKPPGQMGMETLDSSAGPSHAPSGPRTLPIRRDRAVPLPRVAEMTCLQCRTVDLTLCLSDASGGLESAHCGPQTGVHQPISRWHGRRVSKKWFVADDHRGAIRATDHHGERPARFSTEEAGHRLDIFRGGGAARLHRGQRQNSSVWSIRVSSPGEPPLRRITACARLAGRVVVTPPGGSSDAAEGAAGPSDPGSPA
jgi:hypothetical protein